MWIKFLVKLISLLHDDDIDDTDYNDYDDDGMCLVQGFLSDFIIHTTSLFSNEKRHLLSTLCNIFLGQSLSGEHFSTPVLKSLS